MLESAEDEEFFQSVSSSTCNSNHSSASKKSYSSQDLLDEEVPKKKKVGGGPRLGDWKVLPNRFASLGLCELGKSALADESKLELKKVLKS